MTGLLRSRPLRVDILTAFVSVLVVTVAVIAGHVYSENRHAVLALSDQLIESASRQAIQAATDHFTPAQTSARIAGELARPASIPLIRNRALVDYCLEIVRYYPHLTMANIGDEQGNFLMHKRMSDGTIATKIVDRTTDRPAVTWQYRDESGKIVRSETSHNVRYDPRVRPWYRGAWESGDTFWTDIYVFFTDRIPGINAAHPVRGADGRYVGVVSVDIELADISSFLSTLEIGRQGVAYIVNASGQLVAYPDVRETVRLEGEDMRPGRADELGNPWVRESYRAYLARRRDRFAFHYGGERYIACFHALPQPIRSDWRLAVVVPEDDFIGVLNSASRTALFLSLLVLLIALFVAWFLARSISRPIVDLALETAAIRDFELEESRPRRSHIQEIQLMHDALAAMRKGLMAFRSYVPAQLVRELIRAGQGAQLGGVRRCLTVCFTDIESFTTISETADPEAFTLQVSEYLNVLMPAIMHNRGTIDKFTGDGLMAFWGAPTEDPDQAAHALTAALECQGAVAALNQRWRDEGKPELRTRVGVHTGETLVGNIGTSERMNYTAMGDTVNLASRLEGTNKVYGTYTIVSQSTLDAAGEGFIARPLDVVAVKGRTGGIAIYELAGRVGMPGGEAVAGFCEAFGAAYRVWRERRWKDALALFEELERGHPGDVPTALYVRRCREFAESSPPEDWDGVSQIEVK